MFKCKICGLIDENRKSIRQHLKDEHGLKGGKDKKQRPRQPLSLSHEVI